MRFPVKLPGVLRRSLLFHRVITQRGLGKSKLVMLMAGIVGVVVGWYLIAAAGIYDPFKRQREPLSPQVTDAPPGTHGTLRTSAYGPNPGPLPALRHNLVLVNGPAYSGMEDNDLRGYLDGNLHSFPTRRSSDLRKSVV